MKNLAIFGILLAYCLCFHVIVAQTGASDSDSKHLTRLFESEEILNLKLQYSNKELNKNTNDSTYLEAKLTFQLDDGSWKELESKLKARGNFRRKNCYFPPAKFKFKKSIIKGTLFEGNKKLKLILPCLLQNSANDDLVKEFMAYKLFEVISPYHFKTRIVQIDFAEIRGKKIKSHTLKGVLREDDEMVAKRFDGNVLERFVHPLQQDAQTSITNAFFQYMIGNTDYSTAYQHNQKLLFIGKTTICLPFDFDMSGLVDASYAVVSQVQGEVLQITDVKQRMYRGFERNHQIYDSVRQHYLSNKKTLMAVVDSMQPHFESQKEFATARRYISSFFDILEDDKKYKNEIIAQARIK